MTLRTHPVFFTGGLGYKIAGNIDFPPGEPRAFGIFTHCFTCTMNTHAARRICQGLTDQGFDQETPSELDSAPIEMREESPPRSLSQNLKETIPPAPPPLEF